MLKLNEIRINEYYATKSISKFLDGEEGDSIPIINKRTIRSSELFEKLRNNLSPSSPEYRANHLFPPNCRYYGEYASGFYVVIEEPPAFRTIIVGKGMKSEIQALKSSGNLEKYGYKDWVKDNPLPPYKFTLALPYVIFLLSFDSKYSCTGGKIFFRTRQISGFSDILLKTPFLNISESQHICFGDAIHNGPKRSISADVNYAISTFWSTEFNPDYIYNYVAYQKTPGLCDYHTWQYYSNLDPMFIYTADWIQQPDITIGSEIDILKNSFKNMEETQDKTSGYNSLANLFNKSSKKGIVDIPDIENVKEHLLFDVATSIRMDDNLFVDIGDSFKNNKGEVIYVDSYMGFRKMIDPMYISLQRHDRKLLKWKLTPSVYSYISKKIKEERHFTEAILPNGIVIKAGDILEMKNQYKQQIYRMVYYIRLSITGEIEARIGDQYYIICNIEKDVKIVDIITPKYHDLTLHKGEQYLIMQKDIFSLSPVIPVTISTFDSVNHSNSNLTLKFREIIDDDDKKERKPHLIPINTSTKRIYNIPSSSHILPDIFVLNRQLMCCTSIQKPKNRMGNAMVIPNIGLAIEKSVELRIATSTQLINKFVQDNKFKLESWNHIYDFEVGDKVVVANWDDPIDMLTVKQIQGFVENNENGDVTFMLVDKNNTLTHFKYIDGIEGVAKLGAVRKISNTCGELSAGMKINANISGIVMFPKKDTNIIIGFLYDTGGEEPLVLCSNANTLWYSDVLEKFNIIKIDDKTWKKKLHTSINPSKMRYQTGDLLNAKTKYKNSYGYMVYKPNHQQMIQVVHLEYYQKNNYVSCIFDKEFTNDVIFDSFPNPRLSISQMNNLGFIHAFPNFHGMFTKTDQSHSPYRIVNDIRSILNVSSNSE